MLTVRQDLDINIALDDLMNYEYDNESYLYKPSLLACLRSDGGLDISKFMQFQDAPSLFELSLLNEASLIGNDNMLNEASLIGNDNAANGAKMVDDVVICIVRRHSIPFSTEFGMAIASIKLQQEIQFGGQFLFHI
jgi:hypothetical protein